MSAVRLRFAAMLALALPCAAAAQSSCTVAAFAPETVVAPSAIAGHEALGGAIRLIAEGRPAEARAALQEHIAAPTPKTRDRLALAWSLIALAEATQGELDAARHAVAQSRAGGEIVSPRAAAAVHLNLGWTLTEVGHVGETRAALESAARYARAAGDRTLEATALAHLALLEGRIGGDAEGAARRAHAAVTSIPDAATRARLGVALGLALMPERDAARARSAQVLAHGILSKAYADADTARAPRELAHSLGLLGEMQLARGDTRAGAATLGRALALSRSVADDPWRFRWAWKQGVALRASGDRETALARLVEGVELLEHAKTRRAVGRFATSTLARDYRRAYYDLADALLAGAGAAPSQETLARVRATLELSRAAEMEDFFNDPCLAARSARIAAPETLDSAAVLIHPVLFDDRVEILVSHASGLARFATAKDAVSVGREVQRLRNALERPGSDRYRDSAARLHAWLVAPIEQHLQRVGAKTLVWVPDGALRGVPFAALYDGRSHLVERYAIAVTPVAALTDPRPLGRTPIRASLAGLTIASQGFPPLPGVAQELDALSALLGVTALRDERFSVAALQESLRRSPVNTMHIASHGQFAPEAGQTFLVASDGHLTLPQLRASLAAGKLREEPLELIVLSACQTAAGDEKAALGLAGVAIGAGARSAVATLWAVSDESTSILTTAFYREALSGQASRAQALRHAQRALMKDERYAHPFYWAPYILIGNWM